MSYRNLYVEDEIPLQGIIDENSIQICASIPSYMVNAGEDFRDAWHKDYYIPVGVGYAQREGTLWQSLNGLAKLEQLENESKEDFKERVLSQALQWGIYEDAEGNQTFLCNFGNVGKFDDPAVESNGVTYAGQHEADFRELRVQRCAGPDNDQPSRWVDLCLQYTGTLLQRYVSERDHAACVHDGDSPGDVF